MRKVQSVKVLEPAAAIFVYTLQKAFTLATEENYFSDNVFFILFYSMSTFIVILYHALFIAETYFIDVCDNSRKHFRKYQSCW